MREINDRDKFWQEVAIGRTLVEVFTPTCAPCKKMKQEVLPHIEGQIDVILVNGMENPDLVFELGVSSVPALILFENGDIEKISQGFLSLEKLEEFIGA